VEKLPLHNSERPNHDDIIITSGVAEMLLPKLKLH